MTNWKTTIAGAILAVAIAVEPIISEGAVSWRKVGVGALIALVSYLAKDAKAKP